MDKAPGRLRECRLSETRLCGSSFKQFNTFILVKISWHQGTQRAIAQLNPQEEIDIFPQ